MSRLATPEEASLQSDTRKALDTVRQNGKLADIYLQFANSQAAVRAYLHMERALSEGSLETREIEAIKLWVSQQTGCEFCLSTHSFKARHAGLSIEMQKSLRLGKGVDEPRIDCLLKLADTLMNQRGSIDESLLEEAREVGLSDENLVDLTMAMSTIYFTNLTNHLNDSLSSLPPAPELEDGEVRAKL